MGAMGSVSYQFKKMGQLLVEKGAKNFDELFLEAADSGAEDVEDSENMAYVYTQPGDLAKVKDALSEKGIVVREMEFIWQPTMTMSVDAETEEKTLNLLEKLEELDDVQKTYSNVS